MNSYIFSNTKKVRDYFKVHRKTNHFSTPEFLPREDLKKIINQAEPGTLIYIDLSGLSETEITKYLRLISKNENIFYGILDPAHKIKDIAQVFHDGAVDYADRSVLQDGITSKRLNRIAQYLQTHKLEILMKLKQKSGDNLNENYIPSGKDWRDIIPGNEYTFYLMYIELDGKEEMEKKYGRKNLGIALSSFRSYIESSVSSFKGRVWTWSKFGGIILFPFDFDETPSLRCGFRLMLFKHLYDIEESLFPNFLSFRMVLYIGNMVFSEKNTGHIISDSLNSIFHLGQQFAQPGNFYVTEEVLQRDHPVFKNFFINAGIFEGRTIFQMQRPAHWGYVE